MFCCRCVTENDNKKSIVKKPDDHSIIESSVPGVDHKTETNNPSSKLTTKKNSKADMAPSSAAYSNNKGKESTEQMLGTSPRYRLSSDIYTSPYVSVVRGHLGTKVVAVKIYRLKSATVTLSSMKEMERLKAVALNETRLLAIIPYHPNIVRYYMSEDLGETYHIVCEYCAKSLFDLIERKPLHSVVCKDLFRQLCLGLEHLHDVPVAHRDIKPENLLIVYSKNNQTPMLKITDFGFSVQFREGEKLTVYCGTMLYAAPELICSVPYDGRASDVWSALVTLHAMASSRSLFGGSDNLEICSRITERPIRFSSIVPPDVIELLKFGLHRDPSERPTIAGILMHPYFEEYKWTNTQQQNQKGSRLTSSSSASSSLQTLITHNHSDSENSMIGMSTTDLLFENNSRKNSSTSLKIKKSNKNNQSSSSIIVKKNKNNL